MAKITYTDKVALYENANVQDINKVKADDMNEIKTAVNNNETKVLIAISDTAPAQCSTGDLYYNSSSKKIFTATGTNTWSSTGTTPTTNTMYIEYSTQSAYAWDGSDLISVGGGKAEIEVQTTEPTDENVKLWINPNDIPVGIGSYISNTYGVATDKGYSEAYINNMNTYNSTDEIRIGTWFGKPLYRKVIARNESITNNAVVINITTLNIDELVNIYSKNTKGNYTFYNNNYDSSNDKTNIHLNQNNIEVWCGSGTYTSTIWIEYTKTTD